MVNHTVVMVAIKVALSLLKATLLSYYITTTAEPRKDTVAPKIVY